MHSVLCDERWIDVIECVLTNFRKNCPPACPLSVVCSSLVEKRIINQILAQRAQDYVIRILFIARQKRLLCANKT